jgi:uncharacterized protein YwgA
MEAKKVLPLSLLYEADRNRIHGRTRLQKLVFLAQKRMEREGVQPYEYIAYDYGPFSKELLDALEKYERKALIKIEVTQTYDGTDKYIYSLTPKGVKKFKANLDEGPDSEVLETIRQVSSEVIRHFNKMPISELIEYVYDNYPGYAKNSIYS